jgi:hypothetical protein
MSTAAGLIARVGSSNCDVRIKQISPVADKVCTCQVVLAYAQRILESALKLPLP